MSLAARNDPFLETVLLGTYRVERLLGRGGMGSVYAGVHVHLQTPCAIKILLREYSEGSGEALKRFQREAQITSQLGHPNIVRVTDFNFTPEGAPFMVMELLDGETLHRRLKGRGKLSLTEAVLLLGPLCDALGLAHSKGVVHRDLKPENIFLPGEAGLDAAKILDFGISKIRDGNTRLTQADMQMGTQSYMAPEIVCGAAAEADVRSDVFSMGAILFEMLTGQMAYDGPNPMAVMYKLVYQPPPSARALLPELPEAVEGVLQRALATKPEERYQSAPELFAELTQAAMPFLPSAEELDQKRSNVYRFTQTSMKAITKPGQTGAAPAVSGPPTPQPQRALVPAPASEPPARDHPALEDPRPRGARGGGLVMGVIAGLVALCAVGLFFLKSRLTQPTPTPPPAVVVPAAPKAPTPPAPAPAAAPAAAPAPAAAAPAPAAAPAADVKDGDDKKDEEDGDDKSRSRRRRNRERALPRLRLPAPEE